MVATVMAEAESRCLGACGTADQLMPHADAEDGKPVDQGSRHRHGSVEPGGVAWPV